MSAEHAWSPLEKILGATLAALALGILVGTLVAILSGAGGGPRAGAASGSAVGQAAAIAPVYAGLGPIRTESADADPALVLVRLAFPYNPADRPFVEELDDKAPRLHLLASDFFSGKRREDLAPAFEGALKAELRDLLNAALSLGRIEEIWFSAFSVLD